jgi:D-alanine-D-alanine ligase
MKPIKVAVIFGGTNTEHEVSVVSAKSIITSLDPNKYDVLPVMIDKNSQWLTAKNFLPDNTQVNYLPETIGEGTLIQPQSLPQQHPIDIFFPVIHGPYGEDGTIQGLLEMMHVPYVGCGVLASALCMDKSVQKQLCLGAGIPVPQSWTITLEKRNELPELEYPVFVKPANQGSSVGVIKVNDQSQLQPAINEAFTLDVKVIIEAAIPDAREIECAILGTTHDPKASVLGEIIASNDFYDYDAKYIDGKSKAIIPADLSPEMTQEIQSLAKKAFTLTDCYGLARVDFLVNGKTNEIFLNELNTMPGFTTISMYPKLWEASGISYSKLLDRLIELGIKRHTSRSSIKTTYNPKKEWHKNS